MRKILIVSKIALTLASFSSVNAQEFYPKNFQSMIAYYPDKTIMGNRGYLYTKGFKEENDTLYVNDKTSEFIKLTSKIVKNGVESKVSYYTLAANLNNFIKRAVSTGLTKINPNKFEQKIGDEFARIEISRDVNIKGKKFNLLTYTQSIKLIQNTALPKASHDYPFQNSTWYIQSDAAEDKSKERVDVVIKLTKTVNKEGRIDFIDDYNCKITFGAGEKKQSILASYYQSEHWEYNIGTPQLEFRLTEEEINQKPIKKNGRIIYPEPPRVPMGIFEVMTNQYSKEYYKYLFNKTYSLRNDADGFKLSDEIDVSGRNNTIAVPSTPYIEKKKN